MMIEKLKIIWIFFGMLIPLFIVSIMATDCQSCSIIDFYKIFGMGLILLILACYTMYCFKFQKDVMSRQQKFILGLGWTFIIGLFIFFQMKEIYDADALSLSSFLLPLVIIFLSYRKFKKRKDIEE